MTGFPAALIAECQSAALVYGGGEQFKASGLTDVLMVGWPASLLAVAPTVYSADWTVCTDEPCDWVGCVDRQWDIVAGFEGSAFAEIGGWASCARKHVVVLLAGLNPDGIAGAIPAGWSHEIVDNGDGTCWLVLRAHSPKRRARALRYARSSP